MASTMTWQSIMLSDLCKVTQYGYTASATDESVGPKFLRITDIVPEIIDWASVPYCEIDPQKLDKYLLRRGDIVIARTGATTGYAKHIRNIPHSIFASYLIRIRLRSNVDDRYVGYVVESSDYKQFIQANWGGAAQPSANAQILTSYKVHLPPLPTQRKIASILSAYDDLIENNLRRIRILEEMAQNLYREWFVKFRFPGHENARFVNGIPEGWEVMKVPDAIWINPRMSVVKDTEKHFVAMNGLSVDSMLISNVQTKTGNSGTKYMNSDTLFARITPCLENGKTGFVSFLPTDDDIGLGSTEFIVLRSKTLCPEYVYLLARSDDFRDNAIKSMTGASGRQRVQNACFDRYPIIHPDQDTIKEFSKLVKPQFRLVFLLAEKIENARRTRDLLLPRLISGELDVSELDITVEENDTL